MSEIKTEETPVVVEAPKIEGAPALVEAPAPVAEGSTAPAATTETVADTNEEVKEEEAKTEAAEVKAVTEGWLEFKPHGILHFISTRRYFYLQDEPVEFDNLQTYLKKEKKEKPEAAHSTVAHASHTGKGLLFFAKTDAQKTHPIGIIKLSDVAEVISAGTTKFSLKLTNDVWNFEALNTVERDGWVHTLKAKVVEAKESVESVTGSEGYKTALEKFNKKPIAAKSETAKEKEKEKEEEKKDEEEEKEEKKEDEKEKKDKKKEKKEKKKEDGAKSDDSSDDSDSEEEGSSDKKGKKTKRSNSVKGKRTSFFPLLGNKAKKQEKEEKKEEKTEEKKEEEPKLEEPKAQAAGEGSSEVPAPVATEEVKPVEEVKSAEEAPKPIESPPVAEGVTTPKGGNKRHSFFGFFDKKKEVEKKDIEPVKEREVVSDAPPVIAPIGEEQKETEIEEAKPVEAAAPAPVDTTKSPSSPPKESFLDKFGLFKSKDKAPAPAAAAPVPETEAKKEDVVETKPEDTEAVKEGEAIKESDEKVPEAASPKDAKRRSSFFTLGKKDKKPADVKSDTEEESTSKSNPTSPLPKKLNLFRKNSKSAKDAPKAESEEVPPVPEVAPVVPSTTETPGAAITESAAPVEETTPAATQTTAPTAPTTTA